MGIYDREYYRGETRAAGLFARSPVCRAIIFINVAVFVLQRLNILPTEIVENWLRADSESVLKGGHVWELLTATFVHGDLLHLLFNMYVLWVFGHELEAMYGPRDFLALYLSAAVVSTLGWAISDLATGRGGTMVGASGAVFAVLVLYAMYFPRRELLLMFVIPLEVWAMVSLAVALDAFILLSGTVTRTAVAAHISGAAYGYLYKRFDFRLSRFSLGEARRPRLRIVPSDVPREKPAPRPTTGPTWSPNNASASKPASTTTVLPEEQLDARLDEVLAKIAREGRSGLTDDDNRVLQEASRRARNRRSDRL